MKNSPQPETAPTAHAALRIPRQALIVPGRSIGIVATTGARLAINMARVLAADAQKQDASETAA
jgi:hypothetical protein